ncbi:hypothetical protein AUEXF2481DRAFT_25054 [Aureobasidium subglaciale EXF-2481]|uniref:RGS domain-containing protein n=1 Tax=Aureobasidium subglaciale (strain EXF-2481) TaxID=1043005 RepID=A0A074YSM6_AURSE|nr:uncharacterized protein AUEXF2481DRAFT_25054 [Aureobasidium subglaciale EXF-2481]KAI5210251.1 hypothetical protein E4T38_02022 [Aureobasidium subglaciale]KAI5228940.1 hypothetical protein E4T40_01872 [Aureobasidium subglaciale]KAI5232648.1 hypothetical protein E4T41_02092 [Aureobasidium subglaciale]KAI5265971.1 hypothetical protein E4T46_01799 [Aureobasidium subglaciale]KER00769.1 hypothetical protein AUEXF2481DRAFT_25054 [Aureobasidium subglaciale EXF-2481]
MVYSLSYRRPNRVSDGSSLASSNEQRVSSEGSHHSGTSGSIRGIPEALSFDRIIAGGTCPPCTTRDFMNYLKYIEHSAENLQFYLWYKDYVERFDNLPASEKALSPEWSAAQMDAETARPARRKRAPTEIATVLQGTDFADTVPLHAEKRDPFNDPASDSPEMMMKAPVSPTFSEFDSSYTSDERPVSSRSDFHRKADEALGDAGIKWKPFTAQPFREEMTRIITIFIAVDGSRQLNLSGRERSAVLHALQHTTHPSALRAAFTSAEYSLRRQAHPNFIRWAICNGNRPRVIFARGLGISLILLGILAEILITLSSAGRAWRVLPIIALMLGISTLIAAWKGMCVVLHGMHHRHLRPWELFADPEDESSKTGSQSSLINPHTTGSYEDEPWVSKYEKRNVLRKILDREVWIQEPALRQIQDTIFIQSLLGAFLASCVVVGVFCAVPRGGFF